ncbi:hypothetical protein H8356DRAFT_1371993 [Neocallimastix lanati (nom. inval.)]|uniref:Uncharacterized protein n=1 Tax=Neocallimastix californiae TaxID=1754190 RepID=A0A1Y2A862_9FUNG|nr:hypothetical protein H8356DRAFT_1371993 [Neocallimastix sp. JGI-2020a]ORY18664.1 hypothetical protein LY90DRAFT_635009 [Neocallimastix californiae]|eukprot:ORY18664.1 hypothetical protein LY90DRAFT_635009 [Neocallimastix californiae]
MYKYALFIICFIVKIISTFDLNNKIIYTYENITNYENKEKFIYLYKNSKIITKDDVLGIYDEYFISFYCKNDICAYLDNYYSKPFIEIPDKNGNISLYIIKTFEKNDTVSNSYCDNNVCFSYNCTTNTQCLYGKCMNNLCVFDENAPVTHCDDIYTPPGIFKRRSSYMYCGKARYDTCKNDNECSSKRCYEGKCDMQDLGPSDSEDTVNTAITTYAFLLILAFSIFLCCICCFCNNNTKKAKKDTLI